MRRAGCQQTLLVDLVVRRSLKVQDFDKIFAFLSLDTVWLEHVTVGLQVEPLCTCLALGFPCSQAPWTLSGMWAHWDALRCVR